MVKLIHSSLRGKKLLEMYDHRYTVNEHPNATHTAESDV